MVEIIAGEGGADSRAFARELLTMYANYASRCGLGSMLWAAGDGHFVAEFSGRGVWRAFQHEPGNHVVQRVPPTERHGRRHTSVVAVMVLPLPPQAEEVLLPDAELDVKFQPKGGPGGQHRNKTASACRMVHRPTGLSVFIDGRDQHANRRKALQILTARVADLKASQARNGYDALRRSQWTGGNRGEKVRTYNFIFSRVTDHRLEAKSGKLSDIMRGNLGLLWDDRS